MASERVPRFPAPVPNPAAAAGEAGFAEDERTDPGIVVPAASSEPPLLTAKPAFKMPELGPLDTFMRDPEVTEILVNDVRNVMIEKNGKMSFSGLAFAAVDDLNRITRNILDITGRILTPDQPYVDVSLPDGSRVNIVSAPLTLHGPCITIRKFPQRRLDIHSLMRAGMLDRRMAYFLNVCVVGRLNILISGGTGGGKTTLLNALCSFIPKGERVITIEDTPEVLLTHANSVQLLTKVHTPTSPGISSRDLVVNALRMRPDRIIVGECRRTEALDMLQAMNTGHAGSMTTIHANAPRDALSRLETLCLMSEVELPLLAVRKQIVSAIDLIVQVRRSRTGRRRIVGITEVTGMEADTATLQDLFMWEPQADDTGRFKATGLTPTFVDRLKEQGLEFPPGYFA